MSSIIKPIDLQCGSTFKDSSGNILTVIKKEHVKPGKGGAFMQLKCRNVLTGSIFEGRFSVDVSLERVHIDEESLTYTYTENNMVNFINDDYESVEFPLSSFHGGLAKILKSGADFKNPIKLKIRTYNGMVISAELDGSIELKVIETPNSIKGETAKAAAKNAQLEGDITIKVTSHVVNGDYVKVTQNDLDEIS